MALPGCACIGFSEGFKPQCSQVTGAAPLFAQVPFQPVPSATFSFLARVRKVPVGGGGLGHNRMVRSNQGLCTLGSSETQKSVVSTPGKNKAGSRGAETLSPDGKKPTHHCSSDSSLFRTRQSISTEP